MSQAYVVIATEILKKKALETAKELVIAAAFPALEAAVAASENKIDDVVLAALEPTLKAELLKLLEKIA